MKLGGISKKKLISAVDKYRQLIFEAERHIWNNPETGYREIKTSHYMEEKFEEMGYELVRAGNIPGFYTVLDTGRPGPEILIMGELDSLICPNHPESDPKTGYVHACGHHA
jgi:metal-dependent amidase/aminoacylase/carboxypeptidase family protein